VSGGEDVGREREDLGGDGLGGRDGWGGNGEGCELW